MKSANAIRKQHGEADVEIKKLKGRLDDLWMELQETEDCAYDLERERDAYKALASAGMKAKVQEVMAMAEDD